MTDRIPVTKDTLDRVRQFKEGLGVTYDVALNFMLNKLTENDEDEFNAGHRLRLEIPRELLSTDDND